MLDTIYKILGLQTQDSKKLIDLGPIFFLTGLAYLAGNLSSTSLFNSRFGVQYLPLTYLIEAGLLPLQLWLVSYLSQRMPQGSLIKRLFLIIFFGMLLCLLGTFSMVIFKINWRSFYLLLFIVCNVLLRILVPLMWMLANQTCLLQQAKRLFPILGFLYTLGGVFAGLFTRVANAVFTGIATEVVLLLVPVILFGSLFLWHRIILNHFLTKDLEVANQGGAPLKVVIRNVWGTPLLRKALLSFIILASLFYIVDYQFFGVAIKEYPGSDDFTQFFGTFLAFSYGASLLVSLFLNRITSGIGIGKTVVVMGILAVGALLVSGVMNQSRWSLSIFMVTDFLMDTLVFVLVPMINEVFYKLLPARHRAGASLFFAGSINAVGKLLSSIITGLHSAGVITIMVLSMIGIGMAFWYLFLAMQQKHLYFSTLLGCVQNHVVSVLDLESFSPGKFLGKRDLNSLQEALQSTDITKRRIVLEIGAQIKNELLFPSIAAFQTHPDPQIRLLSFQAVPANLNGSGEFWVQALGDPDAEIRCEAIQRLKGIIRDSWKLGALLKDQLNDSSPQVIRETMIALCENGTLGSNLELKQQIHCRIQEMLGGDAENRFQVCQVIEALKATQYANEVKAMAEHESSSRVRGVAVKCLGELGFLKAIPWLLSSYVNADRELKQCIEGALLKMGAGAIDTFVKGVDSRDLDTWYLSVTVLAAIDQDRSFEKLVNRSCELKIKCLRKINGLPERLEEEGMGDLATLYRRRIQENGHTIIEACWNALAGYFDPIIAGQLRQIFNETGPVEKREQGMEILTELALKYPFTAELVSVLHGEPLQASRQPQTQSLIEILTKAKQDFADYWLDNFADYAISLKSERSA